MGYLGWALRPWFSCEVAHREGVQLLFLRFMLVMLKDLHGILLKHPNNIGTNNHVSFHLW